MVSCSKKDIRNVSLDGTIKNSITGQPIRINKNEFLIECWKYGDRDRYGDPSYDSVDRINIYVNEKGEFSSSFDKGSLLIIIIEAEGFEKFVKKIKLKKSKNTFEVDLVPNNS